MLSPLVCYYFLVSNVEFLQSDIIRAPRRSFYSIAPQTHATGPKRSSRVAYGPSGGHGSSHH